MSPHIPQKLLNNGSTGRELVSWIWMMIYPEVILIENQWGQFKMASEKSDPYNLKDFWEPLHVRVANINQRYDNGCSFIAI